jgi:hypothetical protein
MVLLKLIVYLFYYFYFFFYFLFKLLFIKEKNIFLNHTGSFGHQIIAFELVPRFQKKFGKFFCFEYALKERTNNHLFKIYKKHFSTKLMVFKTRSIARIACNASIRSMDIINLIYKKKIFTLNDLYKISLKNIKFKYKQYSDHTQKVEEKIPTIFLDKLLKKKLISHQLPKEEEEKCIEVLKSLNINFKNKKICNIVFRKNFTKYSKDSRFYYDRLRNSYKEKNYIKTINWLIKKNYLVFIRGATKKNVINKKIINKKNIIFIEDIKNKIEIDIMHLYLMLNSSINICQHSGITVFFAAIGKAFCVIDAFPFCNSFVTNKKKNMKVLYPSTLIKNKKVKILQLLNTKYFWGEGYRNAKLLPNTENEIFNTITDTNLKRAKKLIFPKYSEARGRKNINFYY